jgi:molybdopterin-containing oxidoreductase family membrane subunit
MESQDNNTLMNQTAIDNVASDVMRSVRINRSFILWMGFLFTVLAVCIYAYTLQLKKGLIVAGIRDYVSWGMYIANFVFFVATSLVGMLISSVLGLIGFKWVTPVARIAEIIAVAFAAIAGLVIISDMGRPDRLPYVFLFGRVQSPILWDVTVVITYFTISLLLWFIPMIPDLAVAKSKLDEKPAIFKRVYTILSLKWAHHSEQYKILHQTVRILVILIIPMALAIHTVTSWLFAVTPRSGWDSTIFGPYFVSGAFVSGTSALILAMYFFRTNYGLKKYLTDFHFEKIARVLFLVAIIYLYFNINEFLVPAYKMKKFDAIHLQQLFTGEFAPLFWFTQITGLILPIFLLLFKRMRRPLPLMVIAIFVFIASWLKRLIIVVPPQNHPYLPMQYVPENWFVYHPTLIESAITLGSFILVLIIITVLAKFFPVIPIIETVQDEQHEHNLPENHKIS